MTVADVDGNRSPTQRAILEATYRALREHGYADLTLRRIADEFEKSRSLIYYHYPTKDELVASTVEYLIERYEATMALGEIEDPRERLLRYIDVALFGPDDPAFDHWAFHAALLEFRVRALHDAGIRPLIEGNYRSVVALVTAIVEDGIAGGDFQEVDAEGFARLLVGAIDAARTLKIVGVDEDAPATFGRAIETFLVPSLVADGSPDGSP